MTASYPSAVKTFTTKTDGVDDIEASHINDIQLEVTAVETELGLTPSGSADTVKDRLDGSGSQTIAEDGVYSFTPPNAQGIIIVYPSKSTEVAYRGVFAYRTTATEFLQAIVSNSLTATTGELTGTTGSDGNMTVSVHTDGKIYLENRTGASVEMAMVGLGS
jgi:hypothetical protein